MQKDVREAVEANACRATISTRHSGPHQILEILTLMNLITRNEDPKPLGPQRPEAKLTKLSSRHAGSLFLTKNITGTPLYATVMEATMCPSRAHT